MSSVLVSRYLLVLRVATEAVERNINFLLLLIDAVAVFLDVKYLKRLRVDCVLVVAAATCRRRVGTAAATPRRERRGVHDTSRFRHHVLVHAAGFQWLETAAER